jgi:hypothetical protein
VSRFLRKKTSRPASLWFPTPHANKDPLFLHDGVFLSPSYQKNRSPCPSREFCAKEKE